MNFYRIMRWASSSLPAPLKIAGLAMMHLMHRRVLGIFIDPVLGCNLRCRMCYFTDPEKVKQMHGTMTDAQLDNVRKALFHRALKLQIGCGAEPTLYPNLPQLIAMGRRAGIPYISLTTNGQLIATGKVDLAQLVEAGLDELTLSMHGTTRHTYEHLMQRASFDNMLRLIDIIRTTKERFKRFKVRINFTVNSLNIDDLEADRFWQIWQGTQPDIVQLRPVQQIGTSDWTDFDLTPLYDRYDSTIANVAEECHRRGITCIIPEREQILSVATEQAAPDAVIEDLTYCSVDPRQCYKEDFDPATDTYESYHSRHHTFRRLMRAAAGGASSRSKRTSKKLNYHIK